jgi:hypothetical protein
MGSGGLHQRQPTLQSRSGTRLLATIRRIKGLQIGSVLSSGRMIGRGLHQHQFMIIQLRSGIPRMVAAYSHPMFLSLNLPSRQLIS